MPLCIRGIGVRSSPQVTPGPGLQGGPERIWAEAREAREARERAARESRVFMVSFLVWVDVSQRPIRMSMEAKVQHPKMPSNSVLLLCAITPLNRCKLEKRPRPS